MGQVNKENVNKITHYQRPEADQIPAFNAVSDATEEFIKVLLEQVPDCADKTTAIRSAREAKLWANSAIALRGEI